MADEFGREYITNEYGVSVMRYRGDPLPFGFNWIGATVEFRLAGQLVRGEVVDTVHDIFVNHWLVVELYDGNKQVKVGGHYSNFKKVPADGA